MRNEGLLTPNGVGVLDLRAGHAPCKDFNTYMAHLCSPCPLRPQGPGWSILRPQGTRAAKVGHICIEISWMDHPGPGPRKGELRARNGLAPEAEARPTTLNPEN